MYLRVIPLLAQSDKGDTRLPSKSFQLRVQEDYAAQGDPNTGMNQQQRKITTVHRLPCK